MIDKDEVKIKPDRDRKIYKPKKHSKQPTEITKGK